MGALAIAVVLSVAVGISLGVLGGGGSILTVPILVYVAGLEPQSAIATSLLVVGATSLVAVLPHARARRVDVRMGAMLAATSMVGAYGGGRLAHFIPSPVLLGTFAVMMVVTGMAMMRGRAARPTGEAERPWSRIALSGLGIGVLTGLVGAGGGFLIVPALVLLCAVPVQKAIGTSLLVIAMNSFAGLAGHLGHVSIDARVASLVTVAAVAGSFAGAFLATRTKPAVLRKAFAWFVLVVGVVMIGEQSSWAVSALVATALAGAALLRARHAAPREATSGAGP